MADGYKPVIHWITRREACEKQELLSVRESHSAHSDPTAYVAIGRVDRNSEWKCRKKGKEKPRRQPKTCVWHQESAGTGSSELPEITGKETHGTTEFL